MVGIRITRKMRSSVTASPGFEGEEVNVVGELGGEREVVVFVLCPPHFRSSLRLTVQDSTKILVKR